MLPEIFRGRMLEGVILSIFIYVSFIYHFPLKKSTKLTVIISDDDDNDNNRHFLTIYETTYIVLNSLTELSHSSLSKIL